MTDKPTHPLDSPQNRARFDKWEKRSLWGNFNPDDKTTEEEMNERIGRTCAYMLRQLSRKRIPDPDIVFDALSGKRPIPSCGYIECFMDDGDHVH